MITRGRRRKMRGAAMTEMLIGLPVIIILWAGVNYFRVGYTRRLETMNTSHAEAWAKAYSNDGSCYAGGGPFPGFTNEMGSMPTDGSGNSIDKSFSSSMFMYGVAHGPKSLTVNDSRFSATVQSNTTITCNEVVPKDDRNVLTPLVDFIKSML
jgi:hypothetical protein